MKIFISWSGQKSRDIAEYLRTWLLEVIQSLDPFCSHGDIPSGMRWQDVIGQRLSETAFGILIITPDNKESMWICFEAGALSKHIQDTRVIPLTFGLPVSNLKLPLSQFQAKEFSKENIRIILGEINILLDKPLSEAMLNKLFDRSWLELEDHVSKVMSTMTDASGDIVATSPKRSAQDILEEILSLTRDLARRSTYEPRGHLASLGFPTPQGLLGEWARQRAAEEGPPLTVSGTIKMVIGKTARGQSIANITNTVVSFISGFGVQTSDIMRYGRTVSLKVLLPETYSSDESRQEILRQLEAILPNGTLVHSQFSSL